VVEKERPGSAVMFRWGSSIGPKCAQGICHGASTWGRRPSRKMSDAMKMVMTSVHLTTDDEPMMRVTADAISMYPRDVRTRSTP
jgi:hypothetical protein